MDHDLTPSQSAALKITERATSALSLLGFLFVVYTYLLCDGFKKPVNRLIFYAAWSNLGTTIVGFISRDGIPAGQDSAICQFQAFIFQMFGGVDVYWALCMSLNVYLALFRSWTTKRMESQEWKYLSACYGLSFIPAIVYVFVKTEGRGRVYGPAILWCWIDSDWSILRILTLYLIVWLALIGALGIYCFAIAKAWRNRRALVGLLNPLNEDPFAGIVTTEIEIVFSKGEDGPMGDQHAPRWKFDRLDQEEEDKNNPYTVNIQGIPACSKPRPELLRLPTLTRNAALAQENAEAWLYARVAFLYFLAMVICWIPASIYRLMSVISPNQNIFGLSVASVIGLPLQGFLNALVYYVSSQTATKRVFARSTSTILGRSRVKPARDAQRLRDSYPPSDSGGAYFQNLHYSSQPPLPVARSPPQQTDRHPHSGKGNAMASLDSVTNSAQTSIHMV